MEAEQRIPCRRTRVDHSHGGKKIETETVRNGDGRGEV